MGLVPAWGGWLFPLELGLGRGLLTTGRHLTQGHAGMGPDLLRNLAGPPKSVSTQSAGALPASL